MRSKLNFKFLQMATMLAFNGKLLKFQGKVKPAYEGWYLCHYDNGRFKGFYRFFDGEWWHDCSTQEKLVDLMQIGDPDCWYGIDKR